MKKILSFVLVICMLLALISCSNTSQNQTAQTSENSDNSPSYKLKFGHVIAANAPEGIVWQWFADEVSKRSNGVVEIEVYPAEELGSASVQVESLKVGPIDFFAQGTTVFAGPTGISNFNLSAIPFLFGDQKLYQTAMSESGLNAEQSAAMEEIGLHIVNTDRNFFRGPRVLCSTKPIQSLDDMKGLRFRAYESETYIGSYTALGANPLVIAWGETFSALQNSTVYACSSSIDQVISAKLYEVAKHITWTYEYNTDVILVANSEAWNKLPAEYQELITTVANEAGGQMSTKMQESVDSMISTLKSEYGCTFYDIDTAQFRAKLSDYYNTWAQKGVIPESVFKYVF